MSINAAPERHDVRTKDACPLQDRGADQARTKAILAEPACIEVRSHLFQPKATCGDSTPVGLKFQLLGLRQSFWR